MRWIVDSAIEEEGPHVWFCNGCGWRLFLKPSVQPPMQHTWDCPIGTPRDQMRDCSGSWTLESLSPICTITPCTCTGGDCGCFTHDGRKRAAVSI
jgi:hypothetical protein